jgi:hypothetical protein
MTTTAVPLIPGATLSASSALLYTCPANTTAVVKRAVFSNTSSTVATTITCTIVRNGGSPSIPVIPSQPIGPNTPYVSPELAGMTLSPGDAIYANAGTASIVDLVASGIQIV